MKKILSTKYNENSWSIAILGLRLTVGLIMMKHGMEKLSDYNVKHLSFNYLFGAPTDYILTIFAELFCSIFLVLGLFTRFALIPLIIAMGVAFFKYHHHSIDDGETSLLYLITYFVLLLTGPGKISIDKMIAK